MLFRSAATLAIAAAKQALQRSGLAPADIACCVCATLSAPDATPSVACQVQAALGLPENRPALDAALWAHLKTLCRMNGRALADQRYKKYRQIGEMRNA